LNTQKQTIRSKKEGQIVTTNSIRAVGAGSIYHYTKYTPNMIEGVLRDNGINVRTYIDVDYSYDY